MGKLKFASHLNLKTTLIIILLVIATVPTFWRMLRGGIFTMHDFHVFRMFEFHKCISDLVFPCRWAPDSGFLYGEPLFNFYGQFPYILGEIFPLAGLSILATVKILFIFTLTGSAITMFFLSRYLFASNLAGLVSGIFYVYAPYRAVDVWVRGALPEAMAFVWFPAILLFFVKYVKNEKIIDLLLFSLFSAILITTHNLSFLMFLPFMIVLAIYFLTVEKKWKLIKNLILAGFLTLGLSAFYILPVIAESKLVTLGETTQDYYNFRAHFTTLNQLLISRVWGYGASQFGPDDNLSFSTGHLHWILSLLILGYLLITRKLRQNLSTVLFIALAWLALFLTHGRSLPFWEIFKPLNFIQFPWRFLTISTLFFSISAGAAVLFFKNLNWKILSVVILVVIGIIFNFANFRQDKWREISDAEQFSGKLWQEQTASALYDFWPKYGEKVPQSQAPNNPVFVKGEGEIIEFNKKSHSATAEILVETKEAEIQFPIVYFNGWQSNIYEIYPSGEFGQITTKLPEGKHQVELKFINTFSRTVGNYISLGSLILFGLLLIKNPSWQLKLVSKK